MRLRKTFLLEKVGLASAVTALASAVTPQASADSAAKKYADDVIKKMVVGDEGIRRERYSDTRGIDTVGVGHNLGNEQASIEAFNKAFGKDGESIRTSLFSGGKLTDEQAKSLFDVDYEEHRNRAVKMIPNLDTYPPEVQAMLVSGTYRGHVTDSPTFRKLFAAGKYEEAATELLNREEYKNPKKDKKTGKLIAPGVITRLERDANIVRGLAKTKSTQPSVTTQEKNQTPVTTSQSVTTGEYSVVRGDNMYSIAKKYNIKLADLIAANPHIKDPGSIKPNDKLKIPK